jgi:hypothetical protein
MLPHSSHHILLQAAQRPPEVPGRAGVIIQNQCVQRPLNMGVRRAFRHEWSRHHTFHIYYSPHTTALSHIRSAMNRMKSASCSAVSNVSNRSTRSCPLRIMVAVTPSVV